MMKDKKGKALDDPLPNHPYALLGFGEILLIISLAMDGLTGGIQDKMNAGHKPDPHFMMFNMNLWSCLWLFLGKLEILLWSHQASNLFFLLVKALILTGEAIEFLLFVNKYPVVFGYLTLMGLTASVGQVRKLN